MTPTQIVKFLSNKFEPCSPDPLVWGVEYDKTLGKEVLVARLAGPLNLECSCDMPADKDDDTVVFAIGKGMVKSMLMQVIPRVLSLVIIADPEFSDALSGTAKPEDN